MRETDLRLQSVDLPVGALPERLLDAATGDDLVVTDGELRGIDLPGRSGRAFVTPPAG